MFIQIPAQSGWFRLYTELVHLTVLSVHPNSGSARNTRVFQKVNIDTFELCSDRLQNTKAMSTQYSEYYYSCTHDSNPAPYIMDCSRYSNSNAFGTRFAASLVIGQSIRTNNIISNANSIMKREFDMVEVGFVVKVLKARMAGESGVICPLIFLNMLVGICERKSKILIAKS